MNRDRELDQAKSAVFLDNNSAFLGCLLCNLTFVWSDKVKTAGVTDTTFFWNPEWFDSLSKNERSGVLLHELWHIALLHGARRKDRDPKKWNAACDIRINNNLLRDGYMLPQGGLFDQYYMDDSYTEEQIYDDLLSALEEQPWGTNVLESSQNQITAVQAAVVTSKIAGNTAGVSSSLLESFLRPKLPWKVLLHKYLLDKLNQDWSWSRPNRRFRDIYMPSLKEDDGRLISIAMFLDTSGSITDEDLKRFTSEVKFIQEELNPEILSVIQFDTEIQDEKIYREDQKFQKITLKGFGGTDYSPVREYILKHKPTVSIIFTDLYADPMEPVETEVIWIVSNNSEDAPTGKTYHVE